MKRFLIVLLLVSFIFTAGIFITGCGTMPAYFANITITSTPSGAGVYVNGVYKGKTPVSVPLAFGEYDLKLTKEGYEDRVVKLDVKGNINEYHFELAKK